MCGTILHYVIFNLHPYYELKEDFKYYKEKSLAQARFIVTGNNTFKKGEKSEMHVIAWNYNRYMPSALYFVLLPLLLGFLYWLMLGIIGKVRLYPKKRTKFMLEGENSGILEELTRTRRSVVLVNRS